MSHAHSVGYRSRAVQGLATHRMDSQPLGSAYHGHSANCEAWLVAIRTLDDTASLQLTIHSGPAAAPLSRAPAGSSPQEWRPALPRPQHPPAQPRRYLHCSHLQRAPCPCQRLSSSSWRPSCRRPLAWAAEAEAVRPGGCSAPRPPPPRYHHPVLYHPASKMKRNCIGPAA